MLLIGPIQSVSTSEGEYLSYLFLVSKRDLRNRIVINLKHLNNSLRRSISKWGDSIYYTIRSRKAINCV